MVCVICVKRAFPGVPVFPSVRSEAASTRFREPNSREDNMSIWSKKDPYVL